MSYGPTAVTYDGLPISSGGAHGLGRIGLRDAYGQTTSFIDSCMRLVAPREQDFCFQRVPELPDFPDWEPRFRKEFGGGSDRRIRLLDTQVDAAMAFLERVEPQPKNQWGMAPLWFTTSWRVQVLDPATKEPFPGQDPSRYSGVAYAGAALGESRLNLMLSNRASLGVALCFPDIDDSRLRQVIPWLQEHAPFRFASRHWRQWTPTNAGSFRARKFIP
jgi:hypothetical protein